MPRMKIYYKFVKADNLEIRKCIERVDLNVGCVKVSI